MLHRAAWAVNILCGFALCLLGSEQASYALSPGLRAAQLTIQLDDPIPLPPLTGTPSPSTHQQVPDTTPLSFRSAFDPGSAAQPFDARRLSAQDLRRAEQCLADAIYYEAASESDDGQRAVAQVVLNRVRHPAWPKTICGVVYQGSDLPGCQFSYACDGSMQRTPVPHIWARAAGIARAALAGAVFAPVGLATHYHTLKVNPAWNRDLTMTAVLGNHIFYRLPGQKGSPQAFLAAYAGSEPVPLPLPWRGTASRTQVAPMLAMADRRAPRWAAAPSGDDPDQYVAGALPQSEVMPRFRQSGSWIGR